MGNKVTGLKKFVGNKNTVTFVCIILGVLVLYFGYTYRVNSATDPVRVPYAKKTLAKKSKITAEVIGYTNVPRSLITTSKNTILTNSKDIINKYVSYSTTIPQNSYFYGDSIMREEQMPDYAFMNMAEGYTVYSLKVTMATTYANKILPNDYIDIYAKINDRNTGKIMFGPLITSIKVKAIKDDRGNALLENGKNNGTPASMQFEVPSMKDPNDPNKDLFTLLMIAGWINDVELLPVPRGASYTADQGETIVSNEIIRQYIMNYAVKID